MLWLSVYLASQNVSPDIWLCLAQPTGILGAFHRVLGLEGVQIRTSLDAKIWFSNTNIGHSSNLQGLGGKGYIC